MIEKQYICIMKQLIKELLERIDALEKRVEKN